MTDDEHHARAALMGMKYHNDNGGVPFYYKNGTDGIPIITTFIDAETLEPIIETVKSGPHDMMNYRPVSGKVSEAARRASFWPPIE